ncbi:MAG: hypothetical protein AAFZ15_08670 [Bacteroidota bacterium]
MNNKPNFLARLLGIIGYLFLFLLGGFVLFLSVSLYYSLNFEEFDIENITTLLFYSLAPIVFSLAFFKRTKLDIVRKVISQKDLFGSSSTIPFESIRSYRFYKFWGGLSVLNELTNETVYLSHQKGMEELLAWLKENQVPSKKEAGVSVDRLGKGLFSLAFALSLIGKIWNVPINNYVRPFFQFRLEETVLVSGTFEKDHYIRQKELGPDGYLSITLEEFPDVRFNASSFLPDQTFHQDWRDFEGTVLLLTVNKKDYEQIWKDPPFNLLKSTVRTYEVRTLADTVLIKKDVERQE